MTRLVSAGDGARRQVVSVEPLDCAGFDVQYVCGHYEHWAADPPAVATVVVCQQCLDALVEKLRAGGKL